ncbi:MAG TPA: CAP domain-containing protein [Solirubrobacterales bacterium]
MSAKLSLLLALTMLTVLPATAESAIGVAPNHVAHAPAHASTDGPGRGRSIGPTDPCPGQTEAEASTAVQLEAMRCLVNLARRDAGLASLSGSDRLDRSADAKSADILRCDDFSHFACGRDFDFWLEKVGYIPARCWRVSENIAWKGDPKTTVREIFKLLIHSPPHRANILGPYSEIGLGLRVGNLSGHGAAQVWTQHFGSHC